MGFPDRIERCGRAAWPMLAGYADLGSLFLQVLSPLPSLAHS